MAHIVTLKDHNDEISYPITPVGAVFVDNNSTLGDLLDEKANTDLSNVGIGAIATVKIADGAITNDKIDYTTLYGGGASLAHTSTIVNFGPFAGTIHRVGNICWTTGSAVFSSWGAGNRVDTGKTIPAGYTPLAGDIIIDCLCVDGQYSDDVVTLTFLTNGKILRSSSRNITSATRADYSGMWITVDAWPSN